MAEPNTFGEILEEILSLQPDWSWENTPTMETRGRLIRDVGVAQLREWIGDAKVTIPDISVAGGDGVGRKSKVPWIRVFSKSRSPSARIGWYLVFLFSADGSAVYLSLNQGTTDPDTPGGFGARSPHYLDERVRWARVVIQSRGLGELNVAEHISLGDPGLGAGYEQGNVIAIRYLRHAIPEDEILKGDLISMMSALQAVYDEDDKFIPLPNGYRPGEALFGFTKPAVFVKETAQAADESSGAHVIWASDGELLYVGSTGNQRARLMQHLTGDRGASALHDKVGRQLDSELGESASREQIRSYLETCTVAWRSSDDAATLKARIMDELRPRFNDVRPQVQEKPLVLVAYVGQKASTNLRVGLDARTWGFTTKREDYEKLRVGDWILLASGYSAGSPRTSQGEWLSNELAEVFIGRLTRPYYEDATPLWPDEKVGKTSYPHRFQFEAFERLKDVQLSGPHLSPNVVEAIRLSATNRGLGYVESADGSAFERSHTPPQVNADLSLICQDFASALVEANLEFGEHHLDVVRTFLVSLATKRLVLITGLSGSGKSRIALGFGQWLGRKRHLPLAVRPDWTGPESLLGYEDALLPVSSDGRRAWNAPEALRFIIGAAQDANSPYLLLLDEMNLAHVERYFAEVLSGMESDAAVIPNLRDEGGLWRLASETSLNVPANLFVAGTVNVDETTYMFSPKVLDRANTIEFRVRSRDLRADALRPMAVRPGDEMLVQGFLHIARDDAFQASYPADNRDELARRLRDLHQLLSPFGFEFGHRTFYEALRFASLLQAAGEGSPWRALDLQVKQKILPRLHGSMRRLRHPLLTVAHYCFDPGAATGNPDPSFDPEGKAVQDAALPDSFEKVTRMWRSLRANQFVSFSE